jgi:hypothetical protein
VSLLFFNRLSITNPLFVTQKNRVFCGKEHYVPFVYATVPSFEFSFADEAQFQSAGYP